MVDRVFCARTRAFQSAGFCGPIRKIFLQTRGRMTDVNPSGQFAFVQIVLPVPARFEIVTLIEADPNPVAEGGFVLGGCAVDHFGCACEVLLGFAVGQLDFLTGL
jgi:hypothetical protein